MSATATEGTALATLEAAALEELERLEAEALTPAELEKAKAQLKARFVFDDDGITNVAHQIGYFETIASCELYYDLRARVDRVTLDEVAAAASGLLRASNRTVGWFEATGDR